MKILPESVLSFIASPETARVRERSRERPLAFPSIRLPVSVTSKRSINSIPLASASSAEGETASLQFFVTDL